MTLSTEDKQLFDSLDASGGFATLGDRLVYFFPLNTNGYAMDSRTLRSLAAELDRRNAAWQIHLDRKGKERRLEWFDVTTHRDEGVGTKRVLSMSDRGSYAIEERADGTFWSRVPGSDWMQHKSRLYAEESCEHDLEMRS